MASLFRRNRRNDTDPSQDEDAQGKKKGDWKRPANTAFKQQRLKAWQPILTPKTVLPTLFIIGVIFAPIGGLLIWGSSQITQITLDYTDCINAGANFSSTTASFKDMPSSAVSYQLKNPKQTYANPQWSFQSSPNDSDPTKKMQCRLRFELPDDLAQPVFVYYKLTNFFQNHRRYVQSLDVDQLKGKAPDANALNSGNCRPLGRDSSGKAIYPCGLIANSMFNDTLNDPVRVEGSSNTTYKFSHTGIAWPGEKRKYAANSGYQLSQIVPPPNWHERWPQGYTEQNPPPNLNTDEHFQNWMRTAGLPTFSKLYGRNDNEPMLKGTYEMDVYMNFPVSQFGGTKSVVISTVSWIGGKNPFLGYAYIAAAGLFILLAVIGLVWHCLKPRKLGDMNLLSWNQPPGR
ncbi:Meiotically up-regulated gene 89 protein [Serendipita indica DSM 11827]|uniref:Related to cell division protein CDC50 n=1 Tax=Serendipita indica (strain DSM 11827) TaxID=1109443 RepID=G4TL99_SERID|nr:Meiotically up-regulated gene 89 protein [Serendipita indica DSM 11827]CCA72096.1 related to cell division protein CDC50 [Serendipita indica DSM 11827]